MRNPCCRAVSRCRELAAAMSHSVRTHHANPHGFEVFGFGHTLGEATSNWYLAETLLTTRADYA